MLQLRRPLLLLAPLVGVLALTLAVAACGGADSATSTTSPGGGDSTQADLAHARCLREHGIDMPDPQPDGTVDRRGVNPDDPKFEAVERACQQYLPNAGKGPAPNGGGGR